MDLFLIFFVVIFIIFDASWNAVNGQQQHFPRQIMPINVQSQFNPFLPNYQLMQMQQQIMQQQQLQQQAMFQQPQMPMPMGMSKTRGIPQFPAATEDLSNPSTFQQSRSIPFQVSFSGRKNSAEQAPFNGGGLVPVTEKMLDSNSEKLPSSVGNTKRDSLFPDNDEQTTEIISTPAPSPPLPESLPPFLQGAPKEIIDEFKRILRQPQLPYDAKVQQVQLLIQTLSPDRQQLYQQFMGQQQSQQQQSFELNSTSSPPSSQLLYRQPTRPPSRMPQRSPPGGDDGFSMISKILQDESIPENERWQQIVQIYGEAEPKVKNENPFAFDG